ncbi:MAG: hypothetical protein NXI32_12865 [bacterium]|nr:hypothetical protein [bacterium]
MSYIPGSNELQPWLIILGDPPETQLALWWIQDQNMPSLALFSSEEQAAEYASRNCAEPQMIQQYAGTQLTQILVDCYREGIQYAALNPDQNGVQQVFPLKHVLQAAREHYRRQREL